MNYSMPLSILFFALQEKDLGKFPLLKSFSFTFDLLKKP